MDKMRGGWGQKMSFFVHAQGIETVHGGGGVKKWQNSVHVIDEWPPIIYPNHASSKSKFVWFSQSIFFVGFFWTFWFLESFQTFAMSKISWNHSVLPNSIKEKWMTFKCQKVLRLLPQITFQKCIPRGVFERKTDKLV